MAVLQLLLAPLTSRSSAPCVIAVEICLLVALVFVGTFLVTSLQFYIGSSQSDASKKQKALTVPYWIPYLGSVPSLLNQHRLYSSLASKPESNRPLRLKLGPQSIYLMLGPENVRQIYQQSKELSMSQKVRDVMHYNLMPPNDYQIFVDDQSGDLARPTQHIAPEKRVFYNTVRVFERSLTARAESDAIALKFQEMFTEQLRPFRDQDQFSVGIYKFLQKEMLIASGIALNGEELFRQTPEWHQLYWKYDDVFLLLSLNLPRWLAPGVYKARDEFVASIRKWYHASFEKDNLQDSNSRDSTWDTNWGSRFWRHFFINFYQAGLSVDGIASPSAGILWALHSNAIPATAWLLFEILTNRRLYDEIMAELSTVLASTSPPTFDIKRLLELPLLNSVYQEVLRLRVSLIIYREAVHDIIINNTLIPAGAMLITPSWPAHTNPHNWAPVTAPAGLFSATHAPHTTLPADRFDPYRFLAMHSLKADPLAPRPLKDRVAAALAQTSFFPWGGGSHICAGRNFAKQEIFIGAATLLAGFDIEVVGWEKHEKGWPAPRTGKACGMGAARERAAQPNLAHAGGAVMPPDRDLRVRMRRKAA